MRKRDVTMATQTGLALLFFTLMLGVAMRGMQPSPESVVSAAYQEPQPPASSNVPPDQSRPDPKAGKAVVMVGTIVKDASDFVLREQSGKVYRLDAPSKAKRFEGKSVKVTGKLDENSGLIHVDEIVQIAG
jgi:hypothetical protein